MPSYIIRVIPRDDSMFVMAITDTKAEARKTARRMAEHAFPDCRLRWSADCVMAFRALPPAARKALLRMVDAITTGGDGHE